MENWHPHLNYVTHEFGWVQYADAYLKTLFTASLTGVPNFIAHSCTVKVRLLKCVTACLFST